jgi:RNA ligase
MKPYTPNFTEMNKLVEQGYLKQVISPCGNLVLFDYTDKCTYEHKWTKHTKNNRGTIYERYTGKVVSRPFVKFFNMVELSVGVQRNLLKSTSFKVLEKLDGSMIQAFYYNYKWNFATRGSFTSDQAKKAEEIALSKYSYQFSHINKDYTHLFEVIYPENRIVVDYKDVTDIILTAIFHTKTGEEPDIDVTNCFTKCKKYEFNSIQEVIAKLDTLPYNEEGYVVRFSNGERVKFKGKEYVEMHRIVTNTSPLSLWENMSNGKVDRKLLESIPEEFSARYVDIAKQLEKRYKEVLNEVKDTTKSIALICNNDRKEIGLYLSRNEVEYSQLVFPIFLGKSEAIEKLVMREIRPTGNIL